MSVLHYVEELLDFPYFTNFFPSKLMFQMSLSNFNSLRLNFVPVNTGKLSSKTFIRTATNVGPTNSVYTLRVEAPKGVVVTVKPSKLFFSQQVRKQSYAVTVTVDSKNLVLGESGAVFGSLKWLDGKHVVRSPIVVTQLNPL